MSHVITNDPLWYKDAVIYQLHVKSFFDADNDGIGDFAGLFEKLDYVADLGVTTVWLLPFYPSPRRDDGYDIAEYRDVSPDYGTLEDARRFVEEAHKRGLRVITELVINHTSADHPWFQAARKAPPGSAERDFYVWADNDELYSGTRIIFCDTEKSNWTWDDEAQAYYWHRFYSHQPDLNFDNPKVLEEVLSVMHFWLDMGVDGLRLDAIPYLIERDGTSNENLPETHEVLKKIRANLDAHYPDRMLLAEANMWPEDTQQYFGADGDECHMAFHFPLMPRMYMAVAQEDRFPITDIMRQTPAIPDNSQWAIFLRNHDELTLEMVTDAERDYLWNTYASDRRARINLGIRRRLAPLMERDRRRIELMKALLLTMPGTPVLYYGDEIGMGDNIHLGDRDGVRTPMQWSPDRNGGFSRADPAALTLPPIMDPLYGFQAVNVEAQERDPHSMLNWLKRMLAVRREHQAFGRGTQTFLRPANRKILAYLREHEEDVILCVANLSRTAQAVELDLSEYVGRTPVELTGRTAFPPIGNLPYLLTLPPYGFSWFMLSDEAKAPDWSSTAPPVEVERHTFVVREGLKDLTRDEDRAVLEREILPEYVPQRRWFGAKDEQLRSIRLAGVAPMAGVEDLLLAMIEVETERGTSSYTLPLGIAWEGEHSGPFAPNLALARVRRGRRVGLLTDGFAVPAFADAVVAGLQSGAAVETGNGTLEWRSGEELIPCDGLEPEWIAAEQSNSTLILGRRAVVKLLRRIQPGIHPEAEMTRYLRDHGFAYVPPFFGELVRTASDGMPHTLMIAQGFVYNQGDGWQWTLDMLSRLSAETGDNATDFENYDSFASTLGLRLAQMHSLLAQPSNDPAFAPERTGEEEADALRLRVRGEVETAFELAHRAGAAEAEALLARRDALLAAVDRLARGSVGTNRTRIHGDLHLGQVLVTGSDVMVIDFEGEPAKSLEERRAKDDPMRDVAGVVRSLDYAAAVVARNLPAAAETEQERANRVFDEFREQAVAAFLGGYAEVTGVEAGELLDLYLIEKAAYEVRYEAANRPDWIGVPLAGLARIAERLAERGDE
jgi:maltose alpha-D-glucosyltransferase / alpha-amylase